MTLVTRTGADRAALSAEGRVDPITLEVIRAGLISIVREMSVTLTRTAYSTIIREVHDFSCVVFDNRGRLIAQAEGIPSFNGSMGFTLAATAAKFPLAEMAPGDVYLSNDPYFGEGASFHKNDINIVMPIFRDDQLVMLSASKAHYLDIGGKDPGSYSPDAQNTFQEGLAIPPVKLYEEGQLNQAVLDIFLANVRIPDVERGDLAAQLAAGKTAQSRALELVAKYGAEIFEASLDELLDHGERMTRAAIEQIPDGIYEAAGFHDGDGRSDEPIGIQLRLTVGGGQLTVDLTGSAAQRASSSGNCHWLTTVAASREAIMFLADTSMGANEGSYRPIEVIAPPGSVFRPLAPAPTTTGTADMAVRLIELILKALAPVLPEAVIAGTFGTVSALTLAGVDPVTGREFVHFSPYAGGWGARARADGNSAMVSLALRRQLQHSLRGHGDTLPRFARRGLPLARRVGWGRPSSRRLGRCLRLPGARPRRAQRVARPPHVSALRARRRRRRQRQRVGHRCRLDRRADPPSGRRARPARRHEDQPPHRGWRRLRRASPTSSRGGGRGRRQRAADRDSGGRAVWRGVCCRWRDDRRRRHRAPATGARLMPSIAPLRSAQLEPVSAWVGAHSEQLLTFLSELVATPSPNPPGDCDAAADRLEDEMRGFGFDVERREVDRSPGGSAPTVLGWVGQRTEQPALLLNAHLDTSPPGDGWTVDPYGAVRRGGQIYGRGAVLSKGDVAAYVYAAAAASAAGCTSDRSVLVAITADEGSGGELGPRQLLEQGRLRPERVICAGVTHQVTIAHNGCIQAKLCFHGPAIHTALADPTSEVMGQVVLAGQRIADVDRELRARPGCIPGIASPTLSITRICGGECFGMAPGAVEVWLDRRVTPGEHVEAAAAELAELVRLIEADAGARIDFQIVQRAQALRPSPAQERLALAVQAEAELVLGEDVPLRGLALYTDARWFGMQGIPTVMYGAGPSDLAGSGINGSDEHVAEDDVVDAARVLGRVIEQVRAECEGDVNSDFGGADASVTRRTR